LRWFYYQKTGLLLEKSLLQINGRQLLNLQSTQTPLARQHVLLNENHVLRVDPMLAHFRILRVDLLAVVNYALTCGTHALFEMSFYQLLILDIY
jgi:hypothetical protein